jgi:uncharacterized membrane protein
LEEGFASIVEAVCLFVAGQKKTRDGKNEFHFGMLFKSIPMRQASGTYRTVVAIIISIAAVGFGLFLFQRIFW